MGFLSKQLMINNRAYEMFRYGPINSKFADVTLPDLEIIKAGEIKKMVKTAV